MEVSTRFLFSSSPLRSILRTLNVSMQVHMPDERHHKILIVGGGTGGISVASRLAKSFPEQVTLVEPSQMHYYQAAWTFVGCGLRPLKDSYRPMTSVIPHGVNLIQDRVTKFEPENSHLFLSNGQKLSYGCLILALGIDLHYERIPGAVEALEKDPRVCSNYSLDYVLKTFKACQAFAGGRAVFTLPSGPIKCAGAAQKIMYMFEDSLQKSGRRANAELEYFMAHEQLFTVDLYSHRLEDICKKRGIKYHCKHQLVQVDHTKSEAVFEDITTKERKSVHYDLLHITPPMAAPKILSDTPKMSSADSNNFVSVDPYTLKHREFSNVFALGDCCSLPTSKTAAAICPQSYTVAENVRSFLETGKADVSRYDGYTACPLITGHGRGILAEFNYEHLPLETFPIDQSKERYFNYFMKTVIMPAIYWDWLITGLWSGPKKMRKVFHLGFSK